MPTLCPRASEREPEHHLREVCDALAKRIYHHDRRKDGSRQVTLPRQPRESKTPDCRLGDCEYVRGVGAYRSAGYRPVPTPRHLPVEGRIKDIVPRASCAAEENIPHCVDGAHVDA